jgi:hypothetical protein
MTLKSFSRSSRLSRAVRASVGGLGLFAVLAGTSAGCLDRPVAPVKPSTTNIFVDPLIQQVVDKIDLLFMIDNSRSMQDKQRILEQAVPELLSRLITPYCVDEAGNLTNPNGAPCPSGTEPEFSPVDDIHIGIVTSSLGGHGADLCSPKDREWNASQDDKAQLLPSVERRDPNGNLITLPQTGTTGFLAWDPGGKNGGETDRDRLINNFRQQVTAAGETGCGFEASLEAWYRFLIDPDPPLEVVVKDGNAEAVRPNQTVLAQRREFLRPDSLVAIVMLTDENDCSTVDGGVGWLAATGYLNQDEYHLPKATAVCAKNPNDVCCRSCASTEKAPPANCQPVAADPGCAPPVGQSADTDPLNLRCWDQQRRFGVNFLYGVERYIRGLTELTVPDYTNKLVPNPLYSDLSGGNRPSRKQSLVFLAGIVGVPWQDIATEDTLNKPNDLKYLKASELAEKDRWKMILGDPKKGILPTDALMIESVSDRTTLGVNTAHPLMLGNLAPVPAPGQRGNNPINGNEYAPKDKGDLQYACVFPLATPRECAGVSGCDCENEQGTGKPLCNGTQQVFAKGYPGIRHLEVLKGVSETTLQKDNAIVASICPKITDRENPARDNPAYGYNPAVASIIDALKVQLRGKCLPRKLDVDKRTGKVPCVVIEAVPSVNGACNACDPNKARGELTGQNEALIPPVQARLAEIGQCGERAGRSCEDFCLCEILPAPAGPAEQTCLNDKTASNSGDQYGFCYVDPENGRGSDAVVDTCPPTSKRKIQFIGEDTPANGSVAFVACVGGNVTDQGDGGN